MCNRKILGGDLAVDYSVGCVNNYFSGSPLLNHDYLYYFRFWSYYMIVLLKKNIALKFKNNLLSKFYIVGVLLGEGGIFAIIRYFSVD